MLYFGDKKPDFNLISFCCKLHFFITCMHTCLVLQGQCTGLCNLWSKMCKHANVFHWLLFNFRMPSRKRILTCGKLTELFLEHLMKCALTLRKPDNRSCWSRHLEKKIPKMRGSKTESWCHILNCVKLAGCIQRWQCLCNSQDFKWHRVDNVMWLVIMWQLTFHSSSRGTQIAKP